MARDYMVISSDSHIDLRWIEPDLFVKNAPASMRDEVPHVVESKDGPIWFAEGQAMTVVPLNLPISTVFSPDLDVIPPKGVSKHIDRMHEVGFYDGRPHPTTLELRLADMDMGGIDAEIIYGPLGVERQLKTREMVHMVYEIYNSWLADFCKNSPDRLGGLALIASDNPEYAAQELRRCAKLGLRGADFAVTRAVLPIWHRDWDPLWAAAEECQMAISFHTRGIATRIPDEDSDMYREYEPQHSAVRLTVFQLAGTEVLSSLIFSEAVERFPGFQFVLGECGVSWLLYILRRMDLEFEDLASQLNLTMKPSEYWLRQEHTTFQREPGLADVLHVVGEDNVMWGSDYSHADGVWPDTQHWIDLDLQGLSPETRRKITRDNTGKLYGFLK